MPALLSRRIHERHEHDPPPDVNDNAGIGAAQGFNLVAIDRAASTLFVDVPMGLRGLQILVIEDAPDVLGVLTMLLRIEGADVAAAGSGQEALRVFRSRHFDVVVSDLGLTDISGDVLIRAIIEAARRPINIVVITGESQPALTRALEAGAGSSSRSRGSGKASSHTSTDSAWHPPPEGGGYGLVGDTSLGVVGGVAGQRKLWSVEMVATR